MLLGGIVVLGGLENPSPLDALVLVVAIVGSVSSLRVATDEVQRKLCRAKPGSAACDPAA